MTDARHEDLDLSVSMFDGPQDNQPKTLKTNWGAFKRLFAAHKVTSEKHSMPLWSPAIYEPGAARASKNVRYVSCAVADIDSKKQSVDESMIVRLVEHLQPYEYLLHTSHSHEPPGKCAVRVVLPLSAPYEMKNAVAWKKTWQKFERWISIPIDTQCKDASRMYYVPSCPPERQSLALVHSNAGALLVLSDFANLASKGEEKKEEPLSFDERTRLERRMYNYARDAELTLAFRKVLKGEPFASVGERDGTLTKMCGVLAAWAVDVAPSNLAQFFARSLKAMELLEPDAPTLDQAEEKIARFQRADNEKREEEVRDTAEQGEAAIGIQTHRSSNAIADLTNDARSQPFSRDELAAFAQHVGFRGEGAVDRFLSARLIIQYQSAYYIWRVDRYAKPQPQASAATAIRKWFSIMPVQLRRVNNNGQFVTMSLEELVENCGTVAAGVVADMRIQESRYEASSQIFYEAASPLRKVKAVEHPEIHEWLKILGGEKLLDWVAACYRLERQCAALIVKGPQDVGKGLLARGLAMGWTEGGTPADLEAVLYGNFNEELVKCPLVVCDEKLPEKRNISAKLRAFIGSNSRTLARKYLPPTELLGAVRVLITANNDSILNFNEDLSNDDIAAVGNRFIYVEATDRATKYLTPFRERGELDSKWLGEGWIAEHAHWLRQNRRLDESGRFLVMGHEESVHRKLAMQSPVASSVCEWIVRYLENPTHVDREKGAYVERERGHLWVNATAICETWLGFIKHERLPPSTTAVGRALSNLSLCKETRWKDNRQTRMYQINLAIIFDWVDSVGVGDKELMRENLGMDKSEEQVRKEQQERTETKSKNSILDSVKSEDEQQELEQLEAEADTEHEEQRTQDLKDQFEQYAQQQDDIEQLKQDEWSIP